MSRVDVNGIGIEYQVTGQGSPVVLLHGFPDSGRLWRHQVPALAGAGFQVIVPDLRGYGRSDKPEAVEAYSMTQLAGDVMAILADLDVGRAHVVGHDWGAGLAWVLASFAPDRVDRLVVLSVGNPVTFRRTIEQCQRSWYMLLFQFPGIAERWLTDDNWANLRRSGHPDADQVIADLEANGSLTPGLNWYRANVAPESWVGPPVQLPPVQAPTMGIWSTGDGALTEVQMTDSAENVAGPWRYERLDGPGHWLQLDAPDQVNALLLDFLRNGLANQRGRSCPVAASNVSTAARATKATVARRVIARTIATDRNGRRFLVPGLWATGSALSGAGTPVVLATMRAASSRIGMLLRCDARRRMSNASASPQLEWAMMTPLACSIIGMDSSRASSRA